MHTIEILDILLRNRHHAFFKATFTHLGSEGLVGIHLDSDRVLVDIAITLLKVAVAN